MKVDVPILYCCYNRPFNVKKSIAVLKNVKAKSIYIVCDGPKKRHLKTGFLEIQLEGNRSWTNGNVLHDNGR